MKPHRSSGLNQIGPPRRVPTNPEGWLPRNKKQFKPSKELTEFREKHGIVLVTLTDDEAQLRQEISLAKGQAILGRRKLPSLPRLRFLEEPLTEKFKRPKRKKLPKEVRNVIKSR